jgi:predicted ATP-grasp superfamily ATP-dependent carboligase
MSSPYLLILANSARLLAQAARQAGFIPLVVDLYADMDTRHLAKAWRQVASLRQTDIAPAVEYFLNHYPVTQAVYGSGFEAFPDSLHYLQHGLCLCGNTPDTFVAVNDKRYFFKVLDSLQIPYPASVFTAPNLGKHWLSKPLQGHGGVGIQPWQTDRDATECYWQQYQAGIAHSVLFLADGERVQIVGFNRQWTTDGFVFAGIINQTALTAAQQQTLTDWLVNLVPLFKLKGLNSLDFIQDGEALWVLEINPRPPASMQLYASSLLALHVDNRLSEKILPEPACRGYQIVYAPTDICIPNALQWPENCQDRPAPGAVCRKNQPICSIIAHQKTAQSVLEQLQYQQAALFSQLI